MRLFLLLPFLIAACGTDDGSVQKPSLDGPYQCGSNTCGDGQVCVTVESGSQCGVDPDRGIGQYQLYSWTCVDLPASCDGVPSCDCVSGGALCLGAEGREVAFGCI